MRLFVVLSLFAAVPAPSAAQAGAAAESRALAILERAGERYGQIDGFCADFRQVIEVRLLDETKHSRGRMCQQPPNLFVMDFTEPAGDRVVADGTSLWVYYPSTDEGQVFRADLAEGSGGFDFHREFLADPGTKYDARHEGTEAAGERSLEKIRIVPTGAASYARAWVWIDEASGLIHRMILEEENGSVRTVHLSGIEVDPALDPGTFAFTPPPGAAVLQR